MMTGPIIAFPRQAFIFQVLLTKIMLEVFSSYVILDSWNSLKLQCSATFHVSAGIQGEISEILNYSFSDICNRGQGSKDKVNLHLISIQE